MEGFFSRAELTVRPPASRLPNCGHCGLFREARRSAKMPWSGRGRRRVLIVGEWPGWKEDHEGLHFVGPVGDFLRKRLDAIGVDLRRDCWLDNAVRCYAKNIGQRKEAGYAVTDCRPNLLKTIEDLRPDVILLMGRSAIRSVIGYLWREDVGNVGKWIGRQIPAHKINAWVCPTHNPSYIIREERDETARGDPDPVLRVEFDRHLAAAFGLDGCPWPDGPPDYPSRVECVSDPDEAADRLSRFTGGTVAFDLETTTLKPDGPRAEIVCASVCWEGEQTVAFPWAGAARDALAEVLENPDVEKVGWNAKFEDRWCRRVGIRVRGWKWDGMLGAHATDPRKGTTGLKFQVFAALGVPPYNEAVEPYLQSVEPGGNAVNRIRDLEPRRVLKYCGIDSLLQYVICHRQMEEIGV